MLKKFRNRHNIYVHMPISAYMQTIVNFDSHFDGNNIVNGVLSKMLS